MLYVGVKVRSRQSSVVSRQSSVVSRQSSVVSEEALMLSRSIWLPEKLDVIVLCGGYLEETSVKLAGAVVRMGPARLSFLSCTAGLSHCAAARLPLGATNS